MKLEGLGLNQILKDISLHSKLLRLGTSGDCGGRHSQEVSNGLEELMNTSL